MKIIENKNITNDIQKRYIFIEDALKSKHKNIQFCSLLIAVLVLLPLFCVGYFIKLNTVYQIHYMVIVVFSILLVLSLLGLVTASPNFGPAGIFLDILNSKTDIKDLKLYRALLKRLENNEHFKIVEVFYNELVVNCTSSNTKLRLKVSGTSLSENDVPTILNAIESFYKEDIIDAKIAKGCYLKKI